SRDDHRRGRVGAGDRGGTRRADRHDQLRGHLRRLPASATRLSPRRDAGVSALPDPLEALAAVAREPAWVVGGAVRDRALGRATDDYDVAVTGDARGLARELARSAGAHVFALSDTFGVWRVVARDRGWQVDVLPVIGGSIEADLAGRDFTINAI